MRDPYTDPFTGWRPTYVCRDCGEHYPVRVQRKPGLPCVCGSNHFYRVPPQGKD